MKYYNKIIYIYIDLNNINNQYLIIYNKKF